MVTCDVGEAANAGGGGDWCAGAGTWCPELGVVNPIVTPLFRGRGRQRPDPRTPGARGSKETAGWGV